MTKLDDTQVASRLRAMYTTLGERQGELVAPPLRESAVPVTDLDEHRARRRAWIVAAAVAVVVSLVVASFAIVRASTDSSSAPVKPVDDPGALQAFFPTPGPHTGPEMYLVPSAVPAGYLPVVVDGGMRGGGGGLPPTRSQPWIKVASDGTMTSSFSISWQPTDTKSEVAQHPELFPGGLPASNFPTDALDGYDDAVPVEINGKPAIWSERLQTFGWHEGDQTVTVASAMDGPYGAWASHLSRDELLAVAEQVVARPDGGFTLAAAPQGFRAAGEASSWHAGNQSTRYVVYGDGAGHGFSVSLEDDSDVSPGVTLAQPEGRLVSVRGVPAAMTPYANFVTSCDMRDEFLCKAPSSIELATPSTKFATYVQWLERDGTLVTVTAVGLQENSVLDIARNLREVSEREWKQVITSVGAPASTTLAPTTTVAPDATSSVLQMGPADQFVGTEISSNEGEIPASVGLHPVGFGCIGNTVTAENQQCPSDVWTWLARDDQGRLFLLVAGRATDGPTPNTFRVRSATSITGVPAGMGFHFAAAAGATPPGGFGDGGFLVLVTEPADASGVYQPIQAVWTVAPDGTVSHLDRAANPPDRALVVYDECSALKKLSWCS